MDAIITAAGKNSRMVNDFKKNNQTPIHKLKLKINHKELLLHTIENVKSSNVNQITIALGHYQNEIKELLMDNNLMDEVNIMINPDINVGLSQTLVNSIKNNKDNFYLFAAGDQPTLTSTTINKMIKTLSNSPNPKNTVSVLARREIGKLNSAESLGMPFCTYGNLIYNYLKYENDNLNPILRKMIDNGVEFYGIKCQNKLELLNINTYEEYLYLKKEIK